MKKKTVCFILVLALAMSSSVSVFAEGVNNNFDIETQKSCSENNDDVARYIENITGLDDMNTAIGEQDESFYVNGAHSEVTIPVNGDEAIVINPEGDEPISIKLPEQMSSSEGELAGEGTIIHSKNNEDFSVASQVLTEKQGEFEIDSVKNLVTIENENAPKKYDFEYDLPNNYSMIKSEEYKGSDEKNWIYIIDNENMLYDEETGEQYPEIVAVIEPAWAKDSKGNDVKTYYDLNGNRLTQTVFFDENSAFPIVADPKSSTKPKSEKVDSGSTTVKLDHSLAGLASVVPGTYSTYLTASAKKKIAQKIAAKAGSKFIPVLNVASWIVFTYSSVQGWRGYRYTKATISFEKWTIYKRQGSRWARGYVYRNTKVKLSLVK